MRKYEKPNFEIIHISGSENITAFDTSNNINTANIIYSTNAVNIISF